MILLNTTTSASNLEIVYYVTQIIGVVVLVWSAVYAKQQYESQKKHAKITESARLSKYFKEHIIVNVTILTSLFQNKLISDILSKIDLDKIELFSKQELLTFIEEEELNKIKAMLSLKIGDVFSENFPYATNKELTLSSVASRCANDLEYVCIHFNSGIAHTNTVYQSLHQAFFEIMPLLYITISSQNTNEVDKFYTNLIDVYNEWRMIHKEKRLEEEKLIAQEKNRQQCGRKTLVVPPTKFK